MKGVQAAVFPIVMATLARTSEEGRWVLHFRPKKEPHKMFADFDS